jgi:hypothetical protein
VFENPRKVGPEPRIDQEEKPKGRKREPQPPSPNFQTQNNHDHAKEDILSIQGAETKDEILVKEDNVKRAGDRSGD